LLSGNPDNKTSQISKAAEQAKKFEMNIKPEYLKNLVSSSVQIDVP